ncbi:F-box/LRR-repeat protein 5-like [Glandiceps talaboti]
MAPPPAEVDVFSIPHSNIVEQLQDLTSKLQATNFSDHTAWQLILDKVKTTFSDFKIHERIENECIMQKLKCRLKGLKIEIAAVTNVHSDNHLTDMLEMVDDGYHLDRSKTEDDRINFGRMLTKALKEFTKDFLPHLKEEEEVFQALLMQYFSFEELKSIKALVIERHCQLHSRPFEYLKYLTDTAEKPTEDDFEEDSKFWQLPPEIVIKIFSHLGPKDLCRCAQVCTNWSKFAFSGVLWQILHLSRWAQGIWQFGVTVDDYQGNLSDSTPLSSSTEDLYVVVDEDADFDESEESDNSACSALSYTAMCIRKEAKMLTDITKYLIPLIGNGVQKVDLSRSKGVNNGLVYKIIISCPNLKHLNLSQTNVSDVAFKGLGRNGGGSHLEHLDLSGCLKITDTTLIRLAKALGMNPPQIEMCCKEACSNNNNSRHSYDDDNDDDDEEDADENICVPMATRTYDEVAIEDCDSVLKRFSRWNVCDEKQQYPDCCNIARDEYDTWASDSQNQGTLVMYPRTASSCSCCESENRSQYSGHDSKWSEDKMRTYQLQLASDCDDENSSNVCCRQSLSDSNNTRTRRCSGTGSCCSGAGTTERPLEFLDLSSCYQITDEGLSVLAGNGGLPNLRHLNLSGCLNVTAIGLQELAEASPMLEHEHFFYCDNITEGPFQESASGCQNLQCRNKVCCRSGE